MDTFETLTSQGWKEYPDQFRKYARCFFKRFSTPTRSCGNADKEGQQVCIAVSEHEGVESLEIVIYGGLPDDSAITLHNYGLPKDVNVVLALTPRLLSTWEHIANFQTSP